MKCLNEGCFPLSGILLTKRNLSAFVNPLVENSPNLFFLSPLDKCFIIQKVQNRKCAQISIKENKNKNHELLILH